MCQSHTSGIMATDLFQDCLADFKKRLTKKELQQFQISSLDDVKAAILKIQDDQSSRKSMMNLPRVKAFIEAFEQYGNAVEVFLNTSSILCFIWGPMKFCLQVCTFATVFHCYEALLRFIGCKCLGWVLWYTPGRISEACREHPASRSICQPFPRQFSHEGYSRDDLWRRARVPSSCPQSLQQAQYVTLSLLITLLTLKFQLGNNYLERLGKISIAGFNTFWLG